MANEPRGFNKGRSSKFREGYWVRQTPEEGRRTYRSKLCGNNDEDISPKTLNDKNTLCHYNNIIFQYWFVRPDFVTNIIIMSCRQHGYPWPSLATPPSCSSLLVGPQGYILYPHRAAVCRFELVVLLLLGHMRGSIGEHHLWARPYSPSSVLHVLFV